MALLTSDQKARLVKSALAHLGRTHKGDVFPSRLYDAAFRFAINRDLPVATFADVADLNLNRKAVAEEVASEALCQYMAQGHISTEEVEVIKEVRGRDGRMKEIKVTRIRVINNRKPRMSEAPVAHTKGDLPEVVVDTLNHLQEQEVGVDLRIAKLVTAVTNSDAFSIGGVSNPMAGGGLKYGTQYRYLTQFMREVEAGKANPRVRFSWQYLSGRFYVVSPVHHMQGDPIRALFTIPEPKAPSAIGKKMAFRYWKNEFGVTALNYEEIIFLYRELYKIAVADKEPGKPTFSSVWKENMAFFGIPLKKAIRTFAAALAMKDLAETGKTDYIFFPDATSDGMQRLAALTGDKMLGHFTNIQASKKAESLYKTLGRMACNRLRDEEKHLRCFFFDETGTLCKEMCKWPVMRLVYGSGKDSLAKGMLFNNPEDIEGVIDGDGNQIPGALEAKLKKEGAGLLNPDFADAFAASGWENAVANARRLARLYEASLKSLAPAWKPFIMALRQVFLKAVASGQPMEWVLGKGATRVIETWDLDDESPRRVIAIKTALGKEHRISVKEIKPSTRASKAPPLIMHSDDGYAVMLITRKHKKRKRFYLPLHDAHGVGIDGLPKIKEIWKRVFLRMYWGKNRLHDLLTKWGIKTTLFRDGPRFLSRKLFMASKHFLGC